LLSCKKARSLKKSLAPKPNSNLPLVLVFTNHKLSNQPKGDCTLSSSLLTYEFCIIIYEIQFKNQVMIKYSLIIIIQNSTFFYSFFDIGRLYYYILELTGE